MKKQTTKAYPKLFLVAALAFLAVSASAQSVNLIRVNVPFDFMVGGKTLQAGEYIVQRANSNDSVAMMIRSEEGKASAMFLTNAVQASTEPAQAKLVFHRYDDLYFLSEIWTDSENVGRKLPESRDERALERGLATYPSKEKKGKKASPPEVVTVIAGLR